MTRWRTLFRSTLLGWTLAIALGFTAMALILFGFIYWETAVHQRKQIDALLMEEARQIRAAPDAVSAVDAWLDHDVHATRYAGLFGADGRHLAGNLHTLPATLPDDGRPHPATFNGIDRDHDGDDPEEVRAIALRQPDGGRVVIGNDLDALDDMQAIVLRALGLALLPAVALSLIIGAVLAQRGQARIASMHQAIAQIMQGRLGQRLPVRGSRSDLDRLAIAVNRMLDEIQALLEDVRGVGDNLAHDLRTPLTRVRTRLERGREELNTAEEFRDCIDRTVVAVDQTLAVISAVLRIGQIQYHDRRSHFRLVDLSAIARDAFELYEPLAEARDVRLRLETVDRAEVTGDADLLLEALGNLIENAIKFAPPGSEVTLRTLATDGVIRMQVADRGPGIPPEERGRVLRRFYQSEKSRTVGGSGLGLSLVAAVADLHGFRLQIGDAGPGCLVELACGRHAGLPGSA